MTGRWDDFEGECYPEYENSMTLSEIMDELNQETRDAWDEFVRQGAVHQNGEVRYYKNGRKSSGRNRKREQYEQYGRPR